jgi:hypothetical protein
MRLNFCIYQEITIFALIFRKPELGDQRFPILLLANMVNKAKIEELVKEKLDEKAVPC